MYMCLDCYEIYDRHLIKPNPYDDYTFCPKSNCIGNIIEVDELLIPTIRILNQKGYYTKACCSGHYYGQHSNGYIMFEEDIDIPSLPCGWTKEIFANHVTIRSSRKYNKPTIKNFKQICDNAKILVDWALSLPYNDEN